MTQTEEIAAEMRNLRERTKADDDTMRSFAMGMLRAYANDNDLEGVRSVLAALDEVLSES